MSRQQPRLGPELPLLAPRFSREIVRCPDCHAALSAAHWLSDQLGRIRPVCPTGCDSAARILASAEPRIDDSALLEPGKRRKNGPHMRRRLPDLPKKRCGAGLTYEAAACGKWFKPKSNNAGYCEDCQPTVKRIGCNKKAQHRWQREIAERTARRSA